MKAYIQSYANGIPHNYNFMNAYQGFYEMGFEIVSFHNNEKLMESQKEDIVVGYVGTVRARLKDFGIITPEMDYPEKNANHSSCSSVDNNIVSMSPNNNSEIDSSNINMKNNIVKKKNDKKEPLKDYLHCILKREIYAYNDIFKSNPNIIETFRKEFKSFLKTLNYIDNRDIEVERFFLFLHKNNFTISKLVAKKHGKEYLFSQLKYALELSDTYFNMYLYPKYEEFS